MTATQHEGVSPSLNSPVDFHLKAFALIGNRLGVVTQQDEEDFAMILDDVPCDGQVEIIRLLACATAIVLEGLNEFYDLLTGEDPDAEDYEPLIADENRVPMALQYLDALRDTVLGQAVRDDAARGGF